VIKNILCKKTPRNPKIAGHNERKGEHLCDGGLIGDFERNCSDAVYGPDKPATGAPPADDFTTDESIFATPPIADDVFLFLLNLVK
jgi:hypothetical protein